MTEIITACPRNCYSTCTMKVRVEDGRLTGIEPYPRNRATPEGVCLKGLSYVERVVSPDRILRPLRRQPDGRFIPIAWDAALDEIAGHLRRLRDDGDPRSVLYYAASGTKGLLNGVGLDFWRLFGGCTTTYGDLCWPAGLEATRLTLGANKHNAPWDLPNARLIILWGKNAAETNLHQMNFVHEALAQGARLVVVDPRRTETAERAELLIQPRPGTDGALALGLAHLLIRRDRIDTDFIDEHVLGFEAFRELASGYDPDRVAEICGIPAASVETLADMLGEIAPATLCAGFGMQRYANSGQTMRAMIALMAITGNIGRAGAGWQFANLQSAVFDPMPDPIAFYPPAEPRDGLRVSISTARLGRDMLATRDPALKMIWVERGNPLTSNPETHTVREAFRALDFRVVVDQFLTDTAAEADLVLPAKTLFEQTDVIGAYWHPYIQLKPKILEPPGEVKPETEIYRLLALRLGLDEQSIAEKIPGSDEAAVEAWLARRLAKVPGVDLERLREGPLLPPGHEEVAFADLTFPTPSGKIELVSREATERWGLDPLPSYHEPRELGEATAGAASSYPLAFMTPNTKNRIHSQFHNLAMIRALEPEPTASMHPTDARERGIADGDRVKIFNERGSLSLAVRLDHGIRPGCVSVSNGWWSEDGGSVNLCSLGAETDMGHGAAFHENRVQVERIAS